MTNYARIINGTAVDVSSNPKTHFEASFAVEFVEVPDEVHPQWVMDENGSWSAPAVAQPEPEKPVYPKIGPIHFQMLFTPQEMVAATDLRATDKILASFWRLVDDPRTDVIDLGLKSVQDAIEYTLTAIKSAGLDIDVSVRKAEILSGQAK